MMNTGQWRFGVLYNGILIWTQEVLTVKMVAIMLANDAYFRNTALSDLLTLIQSPAKKGR